MFFPFFLFFLFVILISFSILTQIELEIIANFCFTIILQIKTGRFRDKSASDNVGAPEKDSVVTIIPRPTALLSKPKGFQLYNFYIWHFKF